MSFHFFKKNRRHEIRSRPFPNEWLAVVAKLPYYALLPADDQSELQGHIQVFLAEKVIVGAQGFDVSDAMRLVVATHACVLLLHRQTDYFPKLSTVVLYPSAFVSTIRESAGAGTILESEVARVGESNAATGTLVLAWDRVAAEVVDLTSGRDVIFHEFAHQLDGEDGSVDGAPQLPSAARYGAWAQVFTHEYQDFDEALARHQAAWIDPYAVTNPAEFFAVVTEMFFKRPDRLLAHSLDLYQQMAAFFCQDPAARLAAAAPARLEV